MKAFCLLTQHSHVDIEMRLIVVKVLTSALVEMSKIDSVFPSSNFLTVPPSLEAGPSDLLSAVSLAACLLSFIYFFASPIRQSFSTLPDTRRWGMEW